MSGINPLIMLRLSHSNHFTSENSFADSRALGNTSYPNHNTREQDHGGNRESEGTTEPTDRVNTLSTKVPPLQPTGHTLISTCCFQGTVSDQLDDLVDLGKTS